MYTYRTLEIEKAYVLWPDHSVKSWTRKCTPISCANYTPDRAPAPQTEVEGESAACTHAHFVLCRVVGPEDISLFYFRGAICLVHMHMYTYRTLEIEKAYVLWPDHSVKSWTRKFTPISAANYAPDRAPAPQTEVESESTACTHAHFVLCRVVGPEDISLFYFRVAICLVYMHMYTYRTLEIEKAYVLWPDHSVKSWTRKFTPISAANYAPDRAPAPPDRG